MSSTAQDGGRLPGNPMMWVLIASEIAVFGAGLVGFAGARILQPELFAQSQASLDRMVGAANTAVLLTSGLFAALAIAARKNGRSGTSRMWLGAASLLGCIFLWLKISEYLAKAEAGIGIETNTFFTLYYLLTGFHLLHVVFGLAVLAIVAVWNSVENLETGCAFWHMVDLVWVLIFPVIYLVH
ncbi:MAG: cytochrome c oxidase subunit 3 family protein [Rhodobiaceae bacterium]|nr:cytochrome c oxidase subunit 3 family protein [Paracoccaceae bacterium]MCB1474391.1 cytochrome c oxidase subunit 3 family protein [Rhodobiaceae bacterium]